MADVQTVKGSVDSGSLGSTLMHEHVFVLTPEIQVNYPEGWGSEEKRIADAIDRLNELKAAGIDSLVDLTVIGLGRYIPRIEKVAAGTDINIVAATGFYTYNELPHWFNFRPDDVVVEMFVRDITKGIGETNVRAGILKCATDQPGLTPGVERILRCVARAHRETGVPISTHTHAASHRGLDQQRVFSEEGVDLSRVIIGHSGDTTDLDYLEEVMAAGSYIGMDRFGLDGILPFEQRVQVVADLCERGRADRMVLSHDAACHMDWFDETMLRNAMPRWHFLHISNDVIPALKQRGVTDEQVKQMLVDNPRAIFERTGGY